MTVQNRKSRIPKTTVQPNILIQRNKTSKKCDNIESEIRLDQADKWEKQKFAGP